MNRRTNRELAKVINDLSFTLERTSLPDSSKLVTVQAKIPCPSVKLRVNFKPVFKTPTLLITWSAIEGKSLLFPQTAILVSPIIRYSSSGYWAVIHSLVYRKGYRMLLPGNSYHKQSTEHQRC